MRDGQIIRAEAFLDSIDVSSIGDEFAEPALLTWGDATVNDALRLPNPGIAARTGENSTHL